MYLQGQKLVEIASQLNLPEALYADGSALTSGMANARIKKSERSHRKKWATGERKIAPEDRLEIKKAEKYGFFSKYLPDETRRIFSAIEQADPLDLLWHQIQIAYATIIRAQRIAYVRDRDDKTKKNNVWRNV